MVSSADDVGRVAVLVTEARLVSGQDKNFQGQTLAEALGLAGTAERMKKKHKACVQSDEEWSKAIERVKMEQARDCFGEVQVREYAAQESRKGVAHGRIAMAEVEDIANGRSRRQVSSQPTVDQFSLMSEASSVTRVQGGLRDEICDVNGDAERQKRKGGLTDMKYAEFISACNVLVADSRGFLRPAIGR